MASFNSARSVRTYDVFLSFRGKDTRSNFVDHLYAALVQKGLLTFKDDEMLHKGKLISPELVKAIEESRFSVVVFSENYVNSSWCLDELTKIMECQNLTGQKVLPVFYHINPSDLRGGKRTFATAFEKHEKKFRGELEKLDKWREALVAASNISGWHISESFNRGEAEFVNKIVQEILRNIQPHSIDHNLIGVESHVEALNSLLCTEVTEDVRVLGIWGMGGIGKTTIAQAMFRRIAHKFEGSSFVKDIRESSCSRRDICVLQENVLKDLLAMFGRLIIEDPDHGAYMLRTRLSNKKVLLVLDDVDNNKQLEFLAARHDWFGPGSRIIITTRDEHLLVDANFKYKPNCLLFNQAIKLFSIHAFHKNSPPEGYEELSYRAIRYTGYLPLALKVLGSFFRGREASVWESALSRLGKTPSPEIYETLKLSYDGLDVSDKKIFLDIACFFKGKDRVDVTRILDSFGFDPVIGISVLFEKSLITISNKKLGMHDLIQDMGWQIVCESFTNSRVWEVDEIRDLINRNGKLKVIEALMLAYKNEKELDFSAEVFRKMKNLRLLDVESTFTSSEPTFLPQSLRWLCWKKYPFSSLPVEHMSKLVGLDLFSGYIVNLWEGRQILSSLKFVDLRKSRYLKRFPDISGAPNIERLILSRCTRLVEVHQSLGFHRTLVYLDLSFCKKLRCLPSMIEMESLETLILTSCKKLERFPEASPSMVKLSYINLDNCSQIEGLPSSIRYLSGLSCLSLISCKNLKNIPNSIWELKHLKSLYLHNCKKLHHLPGELGSMENLRELLLGFPEEQNCGRLQRSIGFHILSSLCSLRKLDLSWRQINEQNFPQNLHSLSSLEELHLNGNSELTQLPVFISHLSCLKLLELNECKRLRNLNALPSGLQLLKATHCGLLKKIGDLTKENQWLYKIWLLDCHKLLKDRHSKRFLDKVLQKSFLEKCASVNHRANIAIPGSNLPIWLKEQKRGCNVTLKLPPKFYNRILGFVICGVFHVDWHSHYISPRITLRIVNEEDMVPVSQVYSANTTALADRGNVWIGYLPFGFFQQMYHDFQEQDWLHIEGNLSISITRTDDSKAVECGAHIIYKEDVETIKQCRTCISDYGNLVHVDGDAYHEEDTDYDRRLSGNTYVYEEKLEDKNSKLMPVRSRMSYSYREIIDLTVDCKIYAI